jgi:hypothetical protein
LLNTLGPTALCAAGKEIHLQANRATRDAVLQLP